MAGTPEPRARKVVNAYGDGGFRISGERIEGSVIVFPDRALTWPVATLDDVDEASLAEVIASASRVDILLLGCGPSASLVRPDLREFLRRHAISLDAMDTGAACRTYNILLTESRAVAAALIAA